MAQKYLLAAALSLFVGNQLTAATCTEGLKGVESKKGLSASALVEEMIYLRSLGVGLDQVLRVDTKNQERLVSLVDTAETMANEVAEAVVGFLTSPNPANIPSAIFSRKGTIFAEVRETENDDSVEYKNGLYLATFLAKASQRIGETIITKIGPALQNAQKFPRGFHNVRADLGKLLEIVFENTALNKRVALFQPIGEDLLKLVASIKNPDAHDRGRFMRLLETAAPKAWASGPKKLALHVDMLAGKPEEVIPTLQKEGAEPTEHTKMMASVAEIRINLAKVRDSQVRK